ncbi:preprotein translocase subunit YajC [Nocardioides limicola]|uniref:preprotein translocase subunit YajC n=1 Tax=Nocardioides limicola TaxID=2803368 RepID=UPI00193C2449|nr:preprotein translocase subunit YajC [Nocardioides sp. DJM-14]
MELLLPIALIAMFWFLLIAPQRRRSRKMAEVQAGLQPGIRVMLSAGIFGTVDRIDEDSATVHVQVADGVILEVVRGAVVEIAQEFPQPDGEQPEEA